MRRDLTAIAAQRITVVRTLLSWDAFMPGDRATSPHRMRDLETMLGAARELGLRVLVSVTAHSLGDCVMLPAYAVDRRTPRRGVRCLTDARAIPGGPRDIYADPLMIEVQVRWIDALLAAFAGHPGVAAWELGHDPASTIRPRRIAQMAEWAALLAGRVRAKEEVCRLTLSQDDILIARGVRPAALAEHVEVLGLAVHPQRLPLPGDPLDPGHAVFVAELAQALAGRATPLSVELGIASGVAGGTADAQPIAVDAMTAPPDVAARRADEMLQRLADAGVVGLHAAAWADWGDRLRDAPPADRRPWLARRGLVDSAGVSHPIMGAWTALSAQERAASTASPYPSGIDVESYYAALPDSLLDLHASWKGDRSDTPAILD